MSEDSEKFLSRWSRLKRDVTDAEPDASAPLNADLSAAAPLQRQEKDAHAESAPPQLPPVDDLTLDSDFRGFLHPKVDEGVKRAALKKLFSDPHFNVMDGLDTYIDDYSISDPLPAEMLAQMKSAQKIFRWARNELDEDETALVQTASVQVGVDAVPSLEVSTPTDLVPTQEVSRAVETLELQPVSSDAAMPAPETAERDKS